MRRAPEQGNIDERATLILSLPGYYRSNLKESTDFDAPLDVIGTEERLDYGTGETLAPTVEVTFRKVFLAKEGCICFVRQEAGLDEVIVRQADDLSAQVTIRAGAQAGDIKAWITAHGGLQRDFIWMRAPDIYRYFHKC